MPPITAETFELEHFEKLVRGVSVAQEAFAALENDLREEQEDREKAEAERDELKESLDEARSELREQRTLIELIADVERGIRSLDELFTYVRETYE